MLIAVVGKAGVGKTTVLQYIADYFHFPVFLLIGLSINNTQMVKLVMQL